MKLKSLAALIFRILGAVFILGGIEPLALIGDNHAILPLIIEVVFSFVIGYGCIYYSKRLAALFCKGLDDDSA